ncbi:hypothetical protein A3I40_04020 [Candidatus Uhrbacteria bacterium RIFCSPLOWO2_02_FULL_48_12]|uniref:UPF0235 protein A3I40_04020 n=1 Tax=Candidatus Uhrbacteria bacterium RIFCSPLOWO2_02_FULL_48_12 TaxID=1802407 RepID=A0A1F7VA61_9BACT|nr:MAG: hypothetical protein A3I40_04020 [Candidatus Uhrbacteria bacterium RIFCSPLOWO2_02_FULL_48_12]
MKISVKVRTGAREEGVEEIDDNSFLVRVKAEPIDDKANKALLRVLARYFQVTPSVIKIIHGRSSKHKLIDVPLDNGQL